MSVTLARLEEQLKKCYPGWEYKCEEELFEREGLIRTGWEKDGVKYKLTIDPIVEKNVLCFHVTEILSASPESYTGDRLARLWGAMCYINYRIILGKFSYDPSDGEVRFSVNVPIDNNDFTDEQFDHTMRVVIRMVEEYAPKLKDIVEGRLELEEFIKSDSNRELRRLVEALDQFLQELRARAEFPTTGRKEADDEKKEEKD